MTRFKITINNGIIDKLKLNPLFYLRFDESSYISYRDNKEIDTSKWVSVDKYLIMSLEASEIEIQAEFDKCYRPCLIETQFTHMIDDNNCTHFECT